MSLYDPDHYKGGSIAPWDFIADHNLDFLTGNVIKYLVRAGKKRYEEEIDDLLKAKAYLDKRIKTCSSTRNRPTNVSIGCSQSGPGISEGLQSNELNRLRYEDYAERLDC